MTNAPTTISSTYLKSDEIYLRDYLPMVPFKNYTKPRPILAFEDRVVILTFDSNIPEPVDIHDHRALSSFALINDFRPTREKDIEYQGKKYHGISFVKHGDIYSFDRFLKNKFRGN